MSKHSRSTHAPSTKLRYEQPLQLPRNSEDSELETFEQSEDSPTDDPADAQRSSKSEPDGDGEEEAR